VLELHGGAALEWRPARALLSEFVGDDRRALELWLATTGVVVALHPWMRDLVPYAVRLALERLERPVRRPARCGRPRP
jgi:hypothetical protein